MINDTHSRIFVIYNVDCHYDIRHTQNIFTSVYFFIWHLRKFHFLLDNHYPHNVP